MAQAKRGGGKGRGQRERKLTPRARVYVHATFNNTIITFTDPDGDTILWGSAGSSGFKGSRKSTPYAAQIASGAVAKRAVDHGVREVDIYVRGPGPGREAAIRSIEGAGLRVISIADVTPIPHNGCRPPKKRRI
ncbi:MAG TPA: 30S ribosomal protein S11 [Anaerolineae bacterium]|nr:30S ribosomal protein S11 [Anaerolineae bacterium]